MSQTSVHTEFSRKLWKRIVDCQFKEYAGNHDSDRYGPKPKPTRSEVFGHRIRKFLSRHGYFRKQSLNTVNWEVYQEWAPLIPDLEWLFDKLEDDHSRKTLIDVIVYRLMGPRAISLERNNSRFWDMRKRAATLADTEAAISAEFSGWSLPLFDLSPLGIPVKLYSRPPSIVAQFLLEQYADPTRTVRVQPDDVVIDGGACWGDTALHFASLAGSGGKVLSFELSPENLVIFRKNLELNPELSDRVKIVEKALWDKDDESLEMKVHGPATSITRSDQAGESATIETITIDSLVERESLSKVDFIKMDIEGAETAALHGAERTLKRFRPRLAISLYHSPEDFTVIPRYLDSLDLGYRFSIDHFTIHAEETVLFAISR